MNPIVTAKNLNQVYEVRRGTFSKPMGLKAVKDTSFTVEEGETLAIVGESGCGKSTLARILTMIETPTDGDLTIDDIEVTGDYNPATKSLRSIVQIVFQNPYGALNPRQKVGAILEEPLKINTSLSRSERRAKVRTICQRRHHSNGSRHPVPQALAQRPRRKAPATFRYGASRRFSLQSRRSSRIEL